MQGLSDRLACPASPWRLKFRRRNQAVSPLGKGLNEARLLRGIVQGFTKAVHGFVQAQIEIDESPRRPQSLAEFFTAHHLARSLEQSRQDLERLFLKDDVVTVSAEFGGAQVEFEFAKAD